MQSEPTLDGPFSGIVFAPGEMPKFRPGDSLRVMYRAPIGPFREPTYLRGRTGVVERIVQPTFIDKDEEASGSNAGVRCHYCRVAFSMR